MKTKLLFTVLCFLSLQIFAQNEFKFGQKFTLNRNEEKDVKMWPGDKNTYFMQSVITEQSIPNKYQIIVRKFDNSNNLAGDYSIDMPQIEKFAPVNYLGSYISGNKISFITETYAGKAKTKEIYRINFDTSSQQFSKELVASYPIESTFKSGTAKFETSENGRYGTIIFYEHSPRKEPVKINILVLETQSNNKIWEKKLSLNPGTSDTDLFITNNGNVGLLRSQDQNAFLLYVTPDSENEKLFTEKMKFVSEKLVTIGSKDYLLAFNSIAKGVKFNASNFENLMLYDVQEGKIISNNVVKSYNDGSKISQLLIPYSYASGDTIYLFTESKLEAGSKQVKSPMGSMMISETVYAYGDPRIVAIKTSGEIENITKFNSNKMTSEYGISSLGMSNIKGNVILKTTDLSNISLLDLQNFSSKNIISTDIPNGITEKSLKDDPYRLSGIPYTQALLYRPEVNTLVFPRSMDGNQASIVSIDNFSTR